MSITTPSAYPLQRTYTELHVRDPEESNVAFGASFSLGFEIPAIGGAEASVYLDAEFKNGRSEKYVRSSALLSFPSSGTLLLTRIAALKRR